MAPTPGPRPEVEDRVWDELSGEPFFGRTKPHDLSAFELAELKAGLMQCLPVAQAWLVSKNLREAPLRRAYLLCGSCRPGRRRQLFTCAAAWSAS